MKKGLVSAAAFAVLAVGAVAPAFAADYPVTPETYNPAPANVRDGNLSTYSTLTAGPTITSGPYYGFMSLPNPVDHLHVVTYGGDSGFMTLRGCKPNDNCLTNARYDFTIHAGDNKIPWPAGADRTWIWYWLATPGTSSIRIAELMVADSADPAPPPKVSGVTVSQAGTSQDIAISWSAAGSASTADAATSYDVDVDGVLLSAVTSGTSYTVSGAPWGPHTVKVRGSNSAGLGTWSDPVGVTTVKPAPAKVSGVTVQDGFEEAIVMWDSDPLADGYKVYRDGSLVATVNSNIYDATGLTGGRAYSWSVVAYNSTGSGPASDPVMATPLIPPDLTAPADVTGVDLVPSNGQILVRFNPSTSSDVAGYLVTYEGGVQVDIGLATQHTFTGLTNGHSYTVWVTAYDAAGNYSPGVSAVGAPFDMSDPSRYAQLVTFSVNHGAGMLNTFGQGFRALAPFGLALVLVVYAFWWLLGVARRWIASAH